jgi:hypothetical protein
MIDRDIHKGTECSIIGCRDIRADYYIQLAQVKRYKLGEDAPTTEGFYCTKHSIEQLNSLVKRLENIAGND